MESTIELLREAPDDEYSRLMLEGQLGVDGDRPLPPWPTKSLPGTIMKMEVMAWRWENGYHIHHPDDARPQSWEKVEIVRDEENRPLRPEDVLSRSTKSLLESLMEEDDD